MYQERSSAIVKAASELRGEVRKTNDALSHAMEMAGIDDEDLQDEEMIEEGVKEVGDNQEVRGDPEVRAEAPRNLEVRAEASKNLEVRENLEMSDDPEVMAEAHRNLEVRAEASKNLEMRENSEVRAKAPKKVGGRMVNLAPVKYVSTANSPLRPNMIFFLNIAKNIEDICRAWEREKVAKSGRGTKRRGLMGFKQ